MFQQAKDEFAASWTQDRRGNQHADNIKGQQDLLAKVETAEVVMKKSVIIQASPY